VKPPPFEYYAPSSLDEAIGLLARLGDEAKIIAGGQSLMPLLALRLARPAYLVDLNRVGGLSKIAAPNGGLAQGPAQGLVMGAMVRQRAAERSGLVRERCPLLADALPRIGHPAIRNRGTVGGSLAHADPAAELPAVALALEATLVARSARGERILSASEFFVGHFTTALESDECLVEIRFPAWPDGAGCAFEEASRRHGDFAMVGVAALLRIDSAGNVVDPRIVLTGVGGTAVRAVDAEALLRGARADREAFEAAGERAARDLEPPSDLHASRAYRRHVARALVRRALEQSAERARRPR
jgi:carbon-monoxide dehydrogenase medium subunit